MLYLPSFGSQQIDLQCKIIAQHTPKGIQITGKLIQITDLSIEVQVGI